MLQCVVHHVKPADAQTSPVDPRALDAHGDAQVNAGPARLRLSAVTAALVTVAAESHAQSGGVRGRVRNGCGGGVLLHLNTHNMQITNLLTNEYLFHIYIIISIYIYIKTQVSVYKCVCCT